jgi:hypothetical protein
LIIELAGLFDGQPVAAMAGRMVAPSISWELPSPECGAIRRPGDTGPADHVKSGLSPIGIT